MGAQIVWAHLHYNMHALFYFVISMGETQGIDWVGHGGIDLVKHGEMGWVWHGEGVEWVIGEGVG